jgi:hypothetical protein
VAAVTRAGLLVSLQVLVTATASASDEPFHDLVPFFLSVTVLCEEDKVTFLAAPDIPDKVSYHLFEGQFFRLDLVKAHVCFVSG